jgi:hypothetical protein
MLQGKWARRPRAARTLGAAAGMALLLGPAQAAAATEAPAAGPGAAGSPATAGQRNAMPPAVAHLAARLTRDLRRGDYQVAQGYMKLYTKADCAFSYRVMKSCFANNPAAPYIVPVLPSWPDEYVDPATVNAFGKTRRGYSVSYRLDPKEAIVILGVLPPPGRYLGFQSYLFTRLAGFDRTSGIYQLLKRTDPYLFHIFFAKVPGEPSRIQSLSSLSNAINNVVIGRQSGAAFGTTRFFVITPDRAMNTAVRQALRRAGASSRDIFTEPVPPLGRPLGLRKPADDFVTVMRYAEPVNEAAARRWRHRLPLMVLRIRDLRPHRPARPYRPFAVAPRTAASEAWLSQDLARLTDAVCGRWHQCPGRRTRFADLQSRPFHLVGPSCRAVGMNCLGDTQDTTYMLAGRFGLDSGQVYAVAGTLATRTGNATYAGLSVNETRRLLGVANVPDPALRGTAAPYAAHVPHAGQFFVFYLARSCAGLQSLTGGHCLPIRRRMVPAGGTFGLALRDYIRPGTERGPDSTKLLAPWVIMLKRPAAP